VGQKRHDPSPGRELGSRLFGMSNKMERMMSFYVVQEITREWMVQTKQGRKERISKTIYGFTAMVSSLCQISPYINQN
jgi:hypothetical protein